MVSFKPSVWLRHLLNSSDVFVDTLSVFCLFACVGWPTAWGFDRLFPLPSLVHMERLRRLTHLLVDLLRL